MAIALRACTAAPNTAGLATASVVLNKPTGTVSGDLMVACITVDGSTTSNYTLDTWTPLPTGWTQLDSASNAGIGGFVFYKVAGASEPTSYTFTKSESGQFADESIIAYSGVDNTTPFDVTGSHAVGTAALSVPSITTVTNGAELLLLGGNWAGTAPTLQSGFTNESNQTDGNVIADHAQATAGATGTASYSAGSTPQVAFLLALRPAGGGGTTNVTVADSGTGADTVSVAVAATITDTGTGADVASVAVALTVTNAGTGADAVSIVVATTLTDAGAGTDAASIAVTAPVTDTGSGTDTPSIAATLTVTNAGTGADVVTVTFAALVSDSGHGTESVTVAASVAMPESGTGADALSIGAIVVTITDTGAGVDSVTVIQPPTGGVVVVTLSDAGVATCTVSDALAPIEAAVTLSDAGVAVVTVSDALAPIEATVTLSDAAVAVVAVSDELV